MKRIRMLFITFSFGWLFGICCISSGWAQEPDARELLHQLQARQKQNFTANVCCVVTNLNDPSQKEEDWVYRWKLLHGYRKAKYSGTGRWPGLGGTMAMEESFDGQEFTNYSNWEHGMFDVSGPREFVRGGSGITDKSPEAGYSFLFTIPRYGGWLRGQDVLLKEDFVEKLLAMPDDGLELSKMTNEEEKVVLKLVALLDSGNYTLYFDPKLDYNLVEMSSKKSDDLHPEFATAYYYERMEYVASIKYTQIDGTWFPTSGELETRSKTPDYDGESHYVYRVELTDVELLEELPAEAFRTEWPEGCRVTDRTRGNATFFVDAQGELLPEGDPRVTALQLDKALDAAVADLAKADEQRAVTYREDTRSQEGQAPVAGDEQTPIEQPPITSRRTGIVVAVLAIVVCVGVLAVARTRRGARG